MVGELGGFGLFTEHGVPMKGYHAVRAFRALLDRPRRVEVKGGVAGRIAVAAGLGVDDSSATVLISNFSQPSGRYRIVLKNLPWKGAMSRKVRVIDVARDLGMVEQESSDSAQTTITVELKAPAIGLIELGPTEKRRAE